jgi:hypothetical protein
MDWRLGCLPRLCVLIPPFWFFKPRKKRQPGLFRCVERGWGGGGCPIEGVKPNAHAQISVSASKRHRSKGLALPSAFQTQPSRRVYSCRRRLYSENSALERTNNMNGKLVSAAFFFLFLCCSLELAFAHPHACLCPISGLCFVGIGTYCAPQQTADRGSRHVTLSQQLVGQTGSEQRPCCIWCRVLARGSRSFSLCLPLI